MIIEPRGSSWVVIGRSIRLDGEVEVGLGEKRGPEENEEASKRIKLDDGSDVREGDVSSNNKKRKGKGDVFLAHGVRNRLKFQLDVCILFSDQ